MSENDIIDQMVGRLVGLFDPMKILLFGSRARGEALENSDVDLLVVMDVAKKEKRPLKRRMYAAVAGIGLSKDIVIATPEEVSYYRDIVGTVIYPAVREGVVLYEKLS